MRSVVLGEVGELARDRVAADAELACAYVIDRVKRASGARWRQGDMRPPIRGSEMPEAVHVVATSRLRCVELAVARGLVAWFEGARDVELRFDVPAAAHVLALQSKGRRCVSLLAEGVSSAPHADGLAFALHDLCHLEKFVDPEHHVAQVGFFATVHMATTRPEWPAFDVSFDDAWRSDFEHVTSDMNGSPVFLFAALKMKLKMASRRALARKSGNPPPRGGDLSPDEARTFDATLDELLDLLALNGEIRDAARSISTKRDAAEDARRIVTYFQNAGDNAMRAKIRATSESLAPSSGAR
jgi:hypothetical protein